MPVEHEHKHVLRDLEGAEAACAARGLRPNRLQQFYLGEGCRFRMVEDGGGATAFLFTYKRDCGGRLLEVETEVGRADYDLARSQAAEVLTKARYDFVEGDAYWSVDFLRAPDGRTYFGLAEAETPEGVVAPMPGFLLPFVELSVPHVDNPLFANARLIDPAYAEGCVAAYRAGSLGGSSSSTSK